MAAQDVKNESAPLADSAETQTLELNSLSVDAVQQLIDDFSQALPGLQAIGTDGGRRWFEQYMVEHRFAANEAGIPDLAHGFLEAIDHQKSKYSYLVARLNNSIDKKQEKIDKDLAPFLEGEMKQAHSIKNARLAEAKKWMEAENARVVVEVRQRFSIELGFRKTSKQRDIIKKEKCRTLREVKDKYNERVKWIEEACIDRIATAQSSLNRIEEDKRQAKERAAKTQLSIRRAQELRDWVYETYVRPLHKKRQKSTAEERKPKRSRAQKVAPTRGPSDAQLQTQADATLPMIVLPEQPQPLPWLPVALDTAKPATTPPHPSPSPAALTKRRSSSSVSWQKQPGGGEEKRPALLHCPVESCDHEGFLSRSGLNRHRRKKHSDMLSNQWDTALQKQLEFPTEQPTELYGNHLSMDANRLPSVPSVNGVLQTELTSQSALTETNRIESEPQTADNISTASGSRRPSAAEKDDSNAENLDSKDSAGVKHSTLALENQPIATLLPEVDTHEAAEALLRLSGR